MGCCFSQEPQDNPKINQSSNPAFNPLIPNQPKPPLPQRMSANANETGQSLKLKGNEHFKRKQFGLAIQAYNKAINRPNPNISFYSNLALAYKANGQYQKSIATVDQMIRKSTFQSSEHSQLFIKAQIIKSRCIIIIAKDYCLLGNYTQKESERKLQEISSAVSLLEEVSEKPNKSYEVQQYLISGNKIKLFLEKEVLPQSKKQSLVHYLQGKLTNTKLTGIIATFYESQEAIIADVALQVRQEMKAALRQPEDFILDPITYQIYQSPVIVPSGQSYDESILKQHFKNNGYNDPITHQVFKIGEKVLVRNNNLNNYINEVRKTVHKTDLDFLKY